MLRLFVQIKDRLAHLGRDESGQDAFEYLLVIGVVMVAIVTAVVVAGPDSTAAVWDAIQDAVVVRAGGVAD